MDHVLSCSFNCVFAGKAQHWDQHHQGLCWCCALCWRSQVSSSIRWVPKCKEEQSTECKYLERVICSRLWVNYIISKVFFFFLLFFPVSTVSILQMLCVCPFSAGHKREAGMHFFACAFSNLLELSDAFIPNIFCVFDLSWRMYWVGTVIHRRTGYPQGSQVPSPAEFISTRCGSSCSETL